MSHRVLPAFFLLVCLAACGDDPQGVCAGESPPSACGASCAMDSECAIGFHCSESSCTAECLPGAVECAGGGTCDPNGRCQGSGDSSVDVGVADAGAEDAPGADSTCASVDLEVTGTIPSVVFIVDRSRSMDNDFTRRQSRWEVLREQLLADDGLIATLEAQVRFGLVLYTAPRRGGMCPQLISVPAVLNNHEAISDEYRRRDVGLYTPTGAAIGEVTARIDELAPERENTIFVLATDGEPNTCAMRSTDPEAFAAGRVESLDAVEEAFGAGIETYVISVGDDVGEDHLQEVANAGVGAASGAPFWVATDTTGLAEALGEIVGGVVSCELEISGSIDPAEACAGSVELDGMPLPCDDPNGWRANDANHIELLGDACDRLMGGAERVSARFPCDVVLL